MKRLFFTICFLVFAVCVGWTQEFTLPEVKNNVSSVETAFLALLHDVGALSERSVMVDHIKYENTHARYVEYIDFVLNNMTNDKVKSYFQKITDSIGKIDYESLSKRQQDEFEYFLNTGIVDSWTFGIGLIQNDEFPSSI
jgi:hypothetical protein